MNRQRRRIFLVTSLLFSAAFAAVDLKNYLLTGAPFVINDDLLDKFKICATLPGVIPAGAVVLLVYQNVHTYNFYVIECITILSSSLLYGWIVSLIVQKIRGRAK